MAQVPQPQKQDNRKMQRLKEKDQHEQDVKNLLKSLVAGMGSTALGGIAIYIAKGSELVLTCVRGGIPGFIVGGIGIGVLGFFACWGGLRRYCGASPLMKCINDVENQLNGLSAAKAAQGNQLDQLRLDAIRRDEEQARTNLEVEEQRGRDGMSRMMINTQNEGLRGKIGQLDREVASLKTAMADMQKSHKEHLEYVAAFMANLKQGTPCPGPGSPGS